jgi:hypothetical protein
MNTTGQNILKFWERRIFLKQSSSSSGIPAISTDLWAAMIQIRHQVKININLNRFLLKNSSNVVAEQLGKSGRYPATVLAVHLQQQHCKCGKARYELQVPCYLASCSLTGLCWQNQVQIISNNHWISSSNNILIYNRENFLLKNLVLWIRKNKKGKKKIIEINPLHLIFQIKMIQRIQIQQCRDNLTIGKES